MTSDSLPPRPPALHWSPGEHQAGTPGGGNGKTRILREGAGTAWGAHRELRQMHGAWGLSRIQAGESQSARSGSGGTTVHSQECQS